MELFGVPNFKFISISKQKSLELAGKYSSLFTTAAHVFRYVIDFFFFFLIKFGDLVFQEEFQLLVEYRLVHHGHSSGAVQQGGCVWYGTS